MSEIYISAPTVRTIKIAARVFKTELQVYSLRRLDITVGFFFLWLPILLNVFLWKAVYSAQSNAENLLGYSVNQTTTYFVMALICSRIIGTNINHELNKQVLSGDLNRFLVQPVGHFAFHFAIQCARSFTQIGYLIIPMLILLIVFKNNFTLPNTSQFILFALSLSFGLVINFCVYYCFGMMSVWYGRTTAISSSLSRLFDGSLFPISFLPSFLQSISSFLPFQFVFYFPLRIFIGKDETELVFQGILSQLFWIVVLGGVIHLIWRKGVKSYGAFGG